MESDRTTDNLAFEPVASTERLRLRELQPGDAEALYRLNSDPEVMRYTGDSAFPSIAAAEAFLRDYEPYTRDGFGRWAVIQRTDDAFVGWCGLRRQADEEVDLGFRFRREFWSMGYATEAGAASLRLGFDRFGLDEIVGRALRENLPSVSVLQKLGMTFKEIREEGGRFWLIYAVSADAFRASSDQA